MKPPQPARPVIHIAGWITLGIIGLLLESNDPRIGIDRAQLVTASAMLGFGVWAFWRHGLHQITASGLYCLAAAMFVGAAGLWWWWTSPQGTSPDVYLATLTGYWTTLAMYAIFWRKPLVYPRLQVTSPAATHWGVWMGLLAAFAGLATVRLNTGNAIQFTLGGMALLVVAMTLHRVQGGRVIGRLILAGVIVAVFFQVGSEGRGRLNLVTLALVAVVLACTQMETRRIKVWILAGVAPALLLMVRLRERLGVIETGEAYNGIGSVVNPLGDFGHLVRAHESGVFAFARSDTLMSTVLFWVPRSVWPEKPVGFGRELTAILEPQLLATNQSMAAHAYGEWYYSFGWLGVIAMVPVIGLALRWLDRLLARRLEQPVDSRRSLIGLAMVLLLVANIPNLMWAGSFTYVGRTVQQLAIIALLVLPFAGRVRKPRPRSRVQGYEASSPRH